MFSQIKTKVCTCMYILMNGNKLPGTCTDEKAHAGDNLNVQKLMNKFSQMKMLLFTIPWKVQNCRKGPLEMKWGKKNGLAWK